MIRFESEITVLQDNTLDTSHPPWSIELQGEVCGMPNLHRGTDLKTIYFSVYTRHQARHRLLHPRIGAPMHAHTPLTKRGTDRDMYTYAYSIYI